VAMRRGLSLFLSCLFALLFSGAFGACAPEGPSGFVTFNLAPDSSCTYSPSASSNLFYPSGLYDISEGAETNSTSCDSPYRVHLLVNSYLKPNADPMLGRAEPNILQLHSAKVELTTLDGTRLGFNDTDPPLPNPFLVTTNNSLFPAVGATPSSGIAAVEVIPTAYAPSLFELRGQEILAEIQIQGTTTGDVDIEFKPFSYAIEICDGCLTRCESDLAKLMMSREDAAMDQCDDNSGVDGRTCWDPDC
jgi:hypothetical protein